MALPSPVVIVSVLALSVAGIAFVATNGDDDKGALTNVSQQPTTAPPTVTPEPPKVKRKPPVKRGNIYVEVYNNSNISGLAGKAADRAVAAGWKVVGSDNWRGTIPASTVYFPPRLERAAKQMGKDLGIGRLRPAVAPMRLDRLTVILTPDFAR